MTRVVVLLRGVNVGGKHSLSMATLRSGLEAAGCADVVTYIQSGNVALTLPASPQADVADWLEQVIGSLAGFDVPVVVRSPADLRRIVELNPYPEASGINLHVTFFNHAPAGGTFDGVDLASCEPASYTLAGRDLYLWLPDGIGRSKLAVQVERASKKATAIGTTRNWNTVRKLIELAADGSTLR